MAPVAILYSPESFRLQWLLDNRKLGEAWTQRGSASENEDDAVRRMQRRDYKMFLHVGITPEFVDTRQIAAGVLLKRRDKILVLPQTLSLSQRSADAIRGFVKAGGIIVKDGQVGLFDGHGRKLPKTLLARLFQSGTSHVVTLPTSHALATARLLRVLRAAGIPWQARVKGTAGQIEEFVYRHGCVKLLVLLSDMYIAELGHSVSVTISLPRAADAYDVGAQKFLGSVIRIKLDVSNAKPIVIALARAPLVGRVCQKLFNWRACPDQPHAVRRGVQ